LKPLANARLARGSGAPHRAPSTGPPSCCGARFPPWCGGATVAARSGHRHGPRPSTTCT